jgi:hypothetical protein
VHLVGFYYKKDLNIKTAVTWDATPFILLYEYQLLRGTDSFLVEVLHDPWLHGAESFLRN